MLGLACALALAAAALALGGADRPVFLAVNGGAQALPAAVPSGLTVLGHGLVAVMLLAPFLRHAPWVLLAGLYATPAASLFSWAGKRLASAPRPAAVLDPALVHVQGMLLRGNNSFPSGHSITIFVVACVVVLGLPAGRGRTAAVIGALLLALSVAASRLMVGAHWPSDALAGAALGTVAGVLGTWAARRWPLWRRPLAPLVLALVVLACGLSLLGTDTGYPDGRPVQWLAAAAGIAAALLALAQWVRSRRGPPP